VGHNVARSSVGAIGATLMSPDNHIVARIRREPSDATLWSQRSPPPPGRHYS
jgi:hypothetical protein